MSDQAQIFDAPLPLWQSLYADALAHIPPDQRAALRGGAGGLILRHLVASSGFRCTVLYRLSYTFRARVPAIGVLASKLFFWIGRHWYGVSMAGTARIDGGLILPHPQGIVIGADVRIGERAWIFQNVTIGGAPGKTGMPTIGDDARIYTGAVLVGPISLGNDVTIGANAVVTFDVSHQSRVLAAASTVRPS
jgi:serine O-acetyltransferase